MKQGGRVIGIFGLPCAGKSTVIKALLDSSRELIVHISTGDIARRLSDEATKEAMNATGGLYPFEDKIRKEILDTINKRQAQGAACVLLDGCPRTSDQVSWLCECQLIGAGQEGCLVQIIGDNLSKRAANRYRDNGDEMQALKRKVENQQKHIFEMDTMIHRLGLEYHTIQNTELECAVKQLAKIVGVRK